MKLFAIEAYGSYGGGLAIVRAETEERARELVSKVNDSMWHTRYDRPDRVIELTGSGEMVLHHYETGE